MQNVRKITDDWYYVGSSDRRLSRFENLFPLANGVSYNSYLLLDEKTVLLDTVDTSVREQFLENIAAVLGERELDYLIINHMEPDHGAAVLELFVKYPKLTLVCSVQAEKMLHRFFDVDLSGRVWVVKEGDTMLFGRHKVTFLMAPMVHWPEVMTTYDAEDKIIFSADAFGTFRALDGAIFNDEVDFDRDWLPEARRYYGNIVGKFGVQVQALLKKVEALDVRIICPLHGPVWRSNLAGILEKYERWSKYEPEEKGVLIVYGSMYGHTENAANVLATRLAENGNYPVKMYDVSQTHVSELISEVFRYSHLVIAAPTYNAEIYPPMANFLTDMKALNVQNRKVAVIENGSWAPTAGKKVCAVLESMKQMELIAPVITIPSAMKEEQRRELEELAEKCIKK